MGRRVGTGLTFFSSACAAVALYFSVATLSERNETNRRLIDLERPRTARELRTGTREAVKACVHSHVCRRVVLSLVERAAREEAARRRREAARASRHREQRRRGGSRGASRPPSGARVGSGTRPDSTGRTPLAGSRPPRRPNSPHPSSPPRPSSSSPSSPPSSPPRPARPVDVQTPGSVPAPRPVVCTPLVGVNC